MLNHHRSCQILFLYCALALLMGCGPKPPATTWEEEHSLPNHWDGGLLSETPCAAPCFADITPGITTESEVMMIIQDTDHFQNCELKDNTNQGRWISCKGLIINIQNGSGIVEGIGFRALSAFTLYEIVSKYGEPTTAWVAPEGIPEAPQISMIVLLGNKKIRLDLEDKNDTSGTYLVEPSANVTNVVYCSDENCNFAPYLQPWHGYGEYVIDDSWH